MEINRDEEGRIRNVSVVCRLSWREKEQMQLMCKLSGKSQQDYLQERVMVKDVTVYGNPKIFINLKKLLEENIKCLNSLAHSHKINPPKELFEDIRIMTEVLNKMMEYEKTEIK